MLVHGTSQKFVIQPSQNEIIGDALLGIRRFANDVRWKEFWHLKKQEEIAAAEQAKAVAASIIPLDGDQSINPFLLLPEPESSLAIFGTFLRPWLSKSWAPKGSDKLEAFITDLQDALAMMVLECGDDYEPNKRAQDIRALVKVSTAEQVIVPMDKRNYFMLMDAGIYRQKVICHLLKDRKEVPLSCLVEAHKQATELLEDIDRFCWKGEHNFIQELLKSRAIPSPKLLVKDHKDRDTWGDFPTRFVIPATNFTSEFPKMGYIAIKNILDNAGINYTRKTIVQASAAKRTLEKLGITNETHTVISLDIVKFYPSVTYRLVEKVVNHYAKDLPLKDRLTMIRESLRLIKWNGHHIDNLQWQVLWVRWWKICWG
jgi:hypothetical protein